jgi:hypothetical protein
MTAGLLGAAVMEQQKAPSAFVTLPLLGGGARILGPDPGAAAVVVDPLVKLDNPIAVVQSFYGGICDAAGELVQPLEVLLAVDPRSVVPHKQTPTDDVLRMYRALPDGLPKMPIPAGAELAVRVVGGAASLGPLIYCRKRHVVFAARAGETAEPLRSLPPERLDGQKPRPDLPFELLTSPAPADEAAAVYCGGGGRVGRTVTQPLDQLLLDQVLAVRRCEALEQSDPLAANHLAHDHPCCRCAERQRCYPDGDDYAYVADRLVAVSGGETPVVVRPLGEWRLDEAAAILGRRKPADVVAKDEQNAFAAWRAARAQQMQRVGPALLLSGETDGRELLEITRLKLALMADALAQLDAAWRIFERPHLCWTDETIRVAWREPIAAAATSWSFQPILRRFGLAPTSPIVAPDGRALAYPPAFSTPALLPPETVDAARYFNEPLTANVFIKKVTPADGGATVFALLEDTRIAWALFRTSDVLHAEGAGWKAALTPAAERNPADGEGLPFLGTVSGDVSAFERGKQFTGVNCRWHPCFGEAVDLHAFGMLLCDALLGQDERHAKALFDKVALERAELHTSCAGLPVEQREALARQWVAERSEVDAPGQVWSRRNLIYDREQRNAATLEAFPPLLWQASITFVLRLVTEIEGFSFCGDRGSAAPRTADGALLPLMELRGLLALVDDHLFARSAPGAAVQDALK